MMRTPAGKECRYFFGDYYRGRNFEECRLLSAANPRMEWKPDLCTNCPVPEILLANACQNLSLSPYFERKFPLLKKTVGVKPVCLLDGKSGFNPHIGCGKCHPIPDIFFKFESS